MSLHPPKFKFRLSVSSNEYVQEEELLLQRLRLQSRNELDYFNDCLKAEL